MSDKWKQLIDLVVNEEEDKASELFHEIVIENSREIYGNLINDEAVEEDSVEEVSSDEVDNFIDDIKADEEGVREEDDDDDLDGAEDEVNDAMDVPSEEDHA